MPRLFVFLGLSMVIVAALAEPTEPGIKLGIAEACPHMCPDEPGQGFTTEIARTIFEAAGYHVEIVVLPWARAAENTYQGLLDGVLSAGKAEVPGMKFPEQQIAWQKDCFYGRKGDPWRAGKPAAFAGRKTIVFKGWVGELPFKSHFGDDYDRLFEEFSIDRQYYQRVVEMVRTHRADAFWMDETVYAWLEKRQPQLTRNDLENKGCIAQQALFLALSPAHPERSDALARVYDDGMIQLRQTGGLAAILARYGLQVPATE